jgi:hypothetical protein
MGRFIIKLKTDETIGADDVRINEQFVEYITRGTQQRRAINSDQVKSIEKRALGSEGGMRFTGEHDASFDSTPGSV